MSEQIQNIACVVALRVGLWGGRSLRKLKGTDDIQGISVNRETTLGMLVESIKAKLPRGFSWDSNSSPLMYQPTKSSKQNEQRQVSQLAEDGGIFECFLEARARFYRRLPSDALPDYFEQILWVYGNREVSQVQQVIHRAGAVRIQQQQRRIDEFNSQNPQAEIGLISRSYLARSLARLPQNATSEPLREEDLPNNATFVQMNHLDNQLSRPSQRNQGGEFVTLIVRMNGVEMPLEIQRESLVNALGFPISNFNGLATFTDPIVPLQGNDMEDNDHNDTD